MIYGPKGAALGEVSLANRKDVRNAVEAAQSASGWSKTTGHLRAQILYYLAENLAARADEMAANLKAMTGKSGAAEVQASLETLFTFAAWADKYDGQIHNVPIRSVALAMKEPVGTIGMLCADNAPLLGLIRPMAASIAMGNRVVCVPSEPFPLASADLIQVLETSDVPAGVVNILTGAQADLAPHLAAHLNVDAIWSFGPPALAKEIEIASSGNLKRVWISQEPTDQDLLSAATEVKNIWIPYGE